MAFTQVDSWTGKIATVVAPALVAPKGKISYIQGWYTGQANWLPIPIAGAPLNAEFAVSIGVKNEGTVRARMHIAATLITPSYEIALALAEDQDVILEPGQERNIQTARFRLNEIGSFSLLANLSMEPA